MMYTKNEKIVPVPIEDEMKNSYITYAMSVIVGRALPDVRDGLKPVHRRILYTMRELHLEHSKPYKKCARIVGECFVKNTRILTNRGLIPIQDLRLADKVYTQKGMRRVTELYEMPPQGLLKVKLSNGTQNIVTRSQKFKILSRDFKLEWKEAAQLKEGDYIVLKAGYPNIKRKVKLRKTHPQNPVKLSEDLAYFLGIFMSEGWIEKARHRNDTYRICIACNSRSIIEKVADILMKEFDYIPNIEERRYVYNDAEKCTYAIRINRRYVCKFLIENFNLAGLKAPQKNIPYQIFESPKEIVYAFISGLLDGDGSIHAKRASVHYGSVSERLINDAQLLFQHLGIFSQRYSNAIAGKSHFIGDRKVNARHSFYAIECAGVNAQTLAANVKLYEQKKEERRIALLGKAIKKTFSDIVPYAGKHIFDELSNKHIGSGWYIDDTGQKFRAGIKYVTGCKIRYSSDLKEKPLRKSQILEWGILDKLNRINSPLYTFLNEVVKDNIFFIEVKSVTPAAPEATYDIQVEGEHEFVANGMVAHNCLGKYHPHGDMAVYDALARMVQNFSLRYPLIDGQGNFGSVDGDAVAAMRYTEARLSHIADWMLFDIDKETVDFMPNFDESLQEPVLLPAALPNLLVNGSSGIAVGMATNIPPHNLGEVVDGVIALVDNPDIAVQELMKHIKAPDFPTSGIICGREGIVEAYTTGRGRLIVHAKAAIEEQKNGKEQIIVTEIPYQVNKTTLIESIAALVRDKKVEGIGDLRDESDKDGMRIVVELKRDANAQVILNQLYKHTQMQETFGVIMLALVNNRPQVLNLKQMVHYYVEHRKEIVIRRTKYELARAEERAHILEGLKIALKNLDKIIELIKKSKDPAVAKTALMGKFDLTERQAQAILEMQLQRLTGLEREKIEAEYLELIKKIAYYKGVLENEKKVLEIIKEEAKQLKEKFGDERRTAVVGKTQDLEIEDLIAEEDVVITTSHSGYIKRFPVSAYRKQKRGGKGVTGAGIKEEDFIEDLFVASTHDDILFFTNQGRAHLLKVYDIPQAGKQSKGKAIINMLSLAQGETVASSIPVKEFAEGKFLTMVTRRGRIKKTELSAFANVRKGGIIAITIEKGDVLIDTRLVSDSDEIFIATRDGKAIRFPHEKIRSMGRGAAGVRGINLGKKDEVIGMAVVRDKKATLLTVTKKGFGKRTEAAQYRLQSRGGKGIINIKVTDKNGPVVGLQMVTDQDDVMLVTQNGMVVRCSAKDIRATGRASQGVRIFRLEDKDAVTSVAPVIRSEDE